MERVMQKTVVNLFAAIVALTAHNALARHQITIVGSSTVYPFATVVAENFGLGTKFKTPRVEATGTGGGLKLFCQGSGMNTPDITNASRRIKKSEIDRCEKNGVSDMIEVKIGYDGIVIGHAQEQKSNTLTLRQVYLALAKDVPNLDGSKSFVPNPYKKWSDIAPQLPTNPIKVWGPPPTSGTRDAFVELGLEGGCKSFDWIKALKKSDKNMYTSRCHAMREDGAFIEAGENDNLIVQKLKINTDAYGIFGFSFLDHNRDSVQGVAISGSKPTFENISDGQYPLARPLYFYVKKAHIGLVPGIAEFVKEFISDYASGDDGYLSDTGLIPLPSVEKKQRAKEVMAQL